MTENQMKYIKYLDSECKRKGIAIRSTDEDLLGQEWEVGYKNITPTYTEQVIITLKQALGISVVMKMKARKKK